MENYFTKLEESLDFIKSRISIEPEVAVILGTGLDGLVEVIDIIDTIDYNDIPHFPESTVEFHQGRLIFGELGGKKIVAMQGRFHYYEGYSMQEITLPVRVMQMLGAKILIISNACGSMNHGINKGSIMIIDDHINLLGDNPLRGINDERLGQRFVDLSQPYSRRLSSLTVQIAEELNLKIYEGVYAAMCGPSLETRAEYRFLKTIGADVVGMSTVPETIVARQMNMEVLGFSIITDECDPDNLKPADIKDIINTAKNSEKDLTILISTLMKRL